MIDDEVAQASYRRLARRLDGPDEKSKPQFLLLIGDQVYVDATAGFFDPTNEFDRFVHPYYNLFALDSVQDVARRLPTYTMIDDHEIEDDWEPKVWTSREPIKGAGVKAYLKYQRAGGSPQQAPVNDSTDPLWYPFKSHGISFFVADTRTERSPRTAAKIESAAIMSNGQFEEIENWLLATKEPVEECAKPKFIATPVPLLPRRRRAIQHGHPASALRSDSWDGYPDSLHRLLAFIAHHKIRGVVFLSGNEHLSNAVEATISESGSKPVRILSILSSGLHSPFPFANAIEADYELPDAFSFPYGSKAAQYSCGVTKREFVSGDGFAIVRLLCVAGKWKVAWSFDRALGQTPWEEWEVDEEEAGEEEEAADGEETTIGGRETKDAERPVDAEEPLLIEARRDVKKE